MLEKAGVWNTTYAICHLDSAWRVTDPVLQLALCNDNGALTAIPPCCGSETTGSCRPLEDLLQCFLQDSLAREEAVTARWAWWPTSTACLQLWRGHWESTQMYPGTGGPSGALLTHLLLAKTKGSSSPSLQPKSIPLRLGWVGSQVRWGPRSAAPEERAELKNWLWWLRCILLADEAQQPPRVPVTINAYWMPTLQVTWTSTFLDYKVVPGLPDHFKWYPKFSTSVRVLLETRSLRPPMSPSVLPFGRLKFFLTDAPSTDLEAECLEQRHLPASTGKRKEMEPLNLSKSSEWAWETRLQIP